MPLTAELDLIQSAQRDPQAFAALYDAYLDRIYNYTLRLTRHPALAEDLTAATFEKALRHLRRFRWQGKSFCAWLYRIARNEAFQHQRKERWLAPLGIGQRSEQDVEAAAFQAERHGRLHAGLAQLAPNDREVLTLRFFEGLSSAETAEVLGCSVDNVYLRLHRALARLRQQLEVVEVEKGTAHVIR
jgi:RNA polymerase sigma-70 factor (ECF subfamily)